MVNPPHQLCKLDATLQATTLIMVPPGGGADATSCSCNGPQYMVVIGVNELNAMVPPEAAQTRSLCCGQPDLRAGARVRRVDYYMFCCFVGMARGVAMTFVQLVSNMS